MPFMTELIVPVCHSDLLEDGRLRTPQDLAGQTLINYVTEPFAWDEWLAAAVPDFVNFRHIGAISFSA